LGQFLLASILRSTASGKHFFLANRHWRAIILTPVIGHFESTAVPGQAAIMTQERFTRWLQQTRQLADVAEQKVKRANEKLLECVSPIVAPLFLYVGFRTLLIWATNVHWGLGLLLAGLLSALLSLLLLSLNARLYSQFAWRVVVSIFLTATLLAVAIFSAVSFIVYQRIPDSYTAGSEITVEKFTDFYLWILVDSLPGLKIWQTFNVSPPMTYEGFVPALCVFVFRVFIVLRLIKAFGAWFKHETPAPQGAPEKFTQPATAEPTIAARHETLAEESTVRELKDGKGSSDGGGCGDRPGV